MYLIVGFPSLIEALSRSEIFIVWQAAGYRVPFDQSLHIESIFPMWQIAPKISSLSIPREA
jgi:hypothetical protein